MLLFITIGSVLWIFMAYDITQYDSHSILDAAEKFIDGDYSPLAAKSSYLQRYPFQLPFVFCAEQIYKITGPGRYMLIRLINVCFLYGIYKCLLKICNFILSGETEKKLASKAPGWNNGFNWDTLKSVDFDAKQAADIGKEAVKEALNNFIEQPTYAIKFFGKKEISQWCEPTYECFNASYHRKHEKPMGNLAKSIYVGTAHKLLLFYFHCYQIISILGILLYCLNVKNVIKVEQLLIPLTILGGFLFHTFMEGKSSYVFPYYIMMIPFSIKGILDLFSAIRGGKMEKKGYEQ